MNIKEDIFSFCLGGTFVYGLEREEISWIVIGLIGIILRILTDGKE